MVKDPNLLVFFDVDYTLFANMFNVNGEMLSAVPSGTKGKIESAYDDFTKYLLYTNDPYKYVHPLKSVQSFVHGLKRRDDYTTVTLDKFVEYFETNPGKMGEINEENESKKYNVIDHSIYDGLIRRSL